MFEPTGPTGEITTPGVKPGNDTKGVVTARQGQQILAGHVTAQNRVLDVDADGRLDVVQYLDGAIQPTVFFNVGGQFNVPGVPYTGDSSATWDFTGFLRPIDADMTVL